MAEGPELQFTDSTEMTRDRSISSGTTNSDPQQPLEYSTTSSESLHRSSDTFQPTAAASSMETSDPITTQANAILSRYQAQSRNTVDSSPEDVPESYERRPYHRKPSILSMDSAITVVPRTHADRSQSTNTMSGSLANFTGPSSAGKHRVSTPCQIFRYICYAFIHAKPACCEQKNYFFVREGKG